jgi:hypothetical protein
MKLWEVAQCVENEGFDYALRKYSNFEDVKDPEFHKLRSDYVDAAEALSDYLGLED